MQSIVSSIGLAIQVRFLSGYQHLDYASATSLRNGASEANDADGSIQPKHPNREDLGTKEEMEGRCEFGERQRERQRSCISEQRGMVDSDLQRIC